MKAKGAGFSMALVGLMFTLSGCVSFTLNASADSVLWGGYDTRKDYQLTRDVFLIREDDGPFSKKQVLAPEGSLKRMLGRHYAAPWSLDDYRRNAASGTPNLPGPAGQVPDVVGIVPAGTRFHCKALDDHRGWTFMTGSFRNLTPSATIIDGAFAGAAVDITDISIYYRDQPGDVFKYRPESGIVAVVGRMP